MMIHRDGVSLPDHPPSRIRVYTAAEREQAEFDRGFVWGSVVALSCIALAGTLYYAAVYAL